MAAPDDPALRERACCRAEPECMLCPLLPQNGDLSLAQLKAMGLHAFLADVGRRARKYYLGLVTIRRSVCRTLRTERARR